MPGNAASQMKNARDDHAVQRQAAHDYTPGLPGLKLGQGLRKACEPRCVQCQPVTLPVEAFARVQTLQPLKKRQLGEHFPRRAMTEPKPLLHLLIFLHPSGLNQQREEVGDGQPWRLWRHIAVRFGAAP